MHILGIETSCDDTAVAVVKAEGGLKRPLFSVLSNISYSQVAIHKKFGGIVPNLASRAHLEKITPTAKTALLIPRINSDEIDLIAVTRGPGLLPSLLVGVNFARALAYKWQKPIIGVNHIEGHIYSNWLQHFISTTFRRSSESGIIENSTFRIIKFPALILIVSGGHTELVLMKDYGKYKIIGETLDDAAGECFDKTARILGLGFPGGPAIAQLADKWEKNKLFRTHILPIGQKCVHIECAHRQIKLPRPMINSKDYNFSFSGLKTAVLYLYNDLVKKYPISKIRPVLACEIQNAIVDVLIAKTLMAVKNYNPKTVMIAGGVSANKKLREEMSIKIAPYKIPFFVPELSYATDNAAMIAATGYFNYLKKKPMPDSWKKLEANANLRL
ncbi:MAG: tRNA (adenosine(37)-N6)-threonylcarbamoyltransferase complex transferase subunit TsaD [Parcubacteria group bacterium]|nr:tRNA (adenosine(37)-N6)-threonylcarbamoyltransferase complex transferase subunit TsaD [Parcubacteria group bacterium]